MNKSYNLDGAKKSALELAKKYRINPTGSASEDSRKIYRNIVDHHDRRMASMMGFSGITMPLKSWLETNGKSINSSIYDASPEIIQRGFDQINYAIPESMKFMVDFGTGGEEMSDLTSIIARGISLLPAYVLADAIVTGRDFGIKHSGRGAQAVIDYGKRLFMEPLKKYLPASNGENHKIARAMREGGRYSFDFFTALGFGTAFEYVKYTAAQSLTGSFDASERTNATMAVAVPSALLHTVRGYFIDVFRDMVGDKQSERTPQWIENMSVKNKKRLFNAAVVGSLVATGIVYANNDAPFFPIEQSENIIEQESLGGLEEKLAEDYVPMSEEDVFRVEYDY